MKRPEEIKYNLVKLYRPGIFGRRRDKIIFNLDTEYGTDNWTLAWCHDNGVLYEFEFACAVFYEISYLRWFEKNPKDLDFICTFGECIDNAATNIRSGRDYTKQEAISTHIQDIAVRNTLEYFGRRFEGPRDKILVIRSSDPVGRKYGPGNIPFYAPDFITRPSKTPLWANENSVECFWQSNKWVCRKEFS